VVRFVSWFHCYSSVFGCSISDFIFVYLSNVVKPRQPNASKEIALTIGAEGWCSLGDIVLIINDAFKHNTHINPATRFDEIAPCSSCSNDLKNPIFTFFINFNNKYGVTLYFRYILD